MKKAILPDGRMAFPLRNIVLDEQSAMPYIAA